MSAFAQNQASKWYFGVGAGLDFMTNPPTVLGGSINTLGNCSSIADAAGNLMFYTDGATVWNQTNAVMSNGTGLAGNSGASVIVKQPGNNPFYHIFTTSVATGLCYSTVDMSLAGGLGAVTTKNFLLSNTYLSGRVAATKHCNKTDIWVIARNGYAYMNNQAQPVNFYAFQVTAAGINTVAVISPLTNSINGPVGFDLGAMKFSPNGRKLGLAASGINGCFFELYDFDIQTGAVTNSLGLLPVANNGNGYGCEFSPDGTKFYGSTLYSNNNNFNPMALLQWDLCAGSATAIAASLYTVATSIGNGGYRGLQLAPNGKIYAVYFGQQALDVINNPDQGGASCGFVAGGQSIAPWAGYYGLPNFVSGFIANPPPLTLFTYTVNQAISCLTASFTAPAPALVTCAAAGYSVVGCQWLFGDPGSGVANTSTLVSPVHNYPSPGTYTVKLVYNYPCSSDTVELPVIINGASLTVNIGSITCAALGSATVLAQGGVGPFSYTWMPGAQSSSVATGLSPGVYSITVVDNGANCVFTSTTVFSSPVPYTGTVASSPGIACNGVGTGTASISLNGGSGNQVYAWYDGVNTQTLATATGLGAGMHTVTVIDAVTSCSVVQLFTISQPPAMTLNIASGTASACAGSSITLTGNNSGGTAGYTYTWTGSTPGNTITVSQATGGTYVYTLSSTDANNCWISNTISLNFMNNPVISTGNTSICPLATGNLVAGGATTYTWSNNTAGNILTDNPTVTSQYTVTGSALGCTAMATASIIVMPAPVPTLSSNSPLCDGDVLLLLGSGGVTFAWDGPVMFSSAVQNPTFNLAAPVNSGVYTATVTGANSCTAGATTAVTVHPLPTVGINPGISALCLNTGSATLYATGTATLYNWAPSNGLSATNTATVAANPQASTVYTLTGSFNGCQAQATATLNVVPPPSLTITLSSNSLCAQALSGSPSSIVLNSSGASTYTLNTPSHISNSNPSGPTSSLSMLPPYQPTGPATATLFGSNGVCTVSTSVVFTVIPNPTVSIPNPTPMICAGQSYTYTSFGADSYTWSAVTPGQTLYTTGSVAVANPSINSVFSVIGNSLGCSSAIQTSTLTVNPLPQLTVSPNSATVCKGSSIQLSASGTGTSYAWSPPVWLSAANGNTVMASSPGFQSYQVISSLNNCTVSAMITVSVVPLPVITISVAHTTLCVNNILLMTGLGGTSYSWTGPGAFKAIGPELNLMASSTSYSGLYAVTSAGNNGCISTATQSITVFDLPTGSFGKGAEGCAPFKADLTFHPGPSSAPISDLSWQVNGQSFNGNSFSYLVASPGVYPVLSTVKDVRNCSATFTVMIQGYPRPEADFYFSPEVPVEGLEPLEFMNNSSGAVKFNWHFIDNNGFTASTPKTSYLFEHAGIYPVSLVAANSFGCSDTVVKTIVVEPDFSIYVPNAFTPNDDGKNDTFFAKGRGVVGFHLGIFDRWGELIFETQDFFKAWDGAYRGQPCKSDVYTWKISASDKYGKTKNMKGFVTLYR